MREGRRWMMVLLLAVFVGMVQAKAEDSEVEKVAGPTEKKVAEDPLVALARARAKALIAIKKSEFLTSGNKCKYDAMSNELYTQLRQITAIFNKAVADENRVDPETRDKDFIKECASRRSDIDAKWNRYITVTRNEKDGERAELVAAWHKIKSAVDGLVGVEKNASGGDADMLAFTSVYQALETRTKELAAELEKNLGERKAKLAEWQEIAKQIKAFDGEHFGR